MILLAASEKVDLFKLHRKEYASPKKPILVNVKTAAYLAIDGRGAPGDAEFQEKIGALYGMAFTVKMTRKFSGLKDYVICKLETIYSGPAGDDAAPDGDDAGPDGSENLGALPREEWRWKFLIRTPDFVKQKEIEKAAAVLIEKGKGAACGAVNLERIGEGRCVQMLHVGPYEREPETVALMESFAATQGLAFHGKHHEIYLSDPRRVPPERLKTILRHPVQPAI